MNRKKKREKLSRHQCGTFMLSKFPNVGNNVPSEMAKHKKLKRERLNCFGVCHYTVGLEYFTTEKVHGYVFFHNC